MNSPTSIFTTGEAGSTQPQHTAPGTAPGTASSTDQDSEPGRASVRLHFDLRDLLRLIAALGVAAGLIMTKIQIRATDFHVDMIIYRAGAKAFLENQPLYFQGFKAGDLGLPFIYPPFGALVLAPLAKPEWVTDEDASAFVVMLSSLCLLLCLYVVMRALLGRALLGRALPERAGVDKHADQQADKHTNKHADKHTQLVAFTVAAVGWPVALLTESVWLNSQFAQVNVILMTLVVLDVVPRKRLLPQGSLIGVAAAIKLTPLVMLLFFFVRKDWRSLFTAVASTLLMTGVAALFSWSRTKEYFTEVVFAMGSGGEFGVNSAYTSNSSIRAVLERWWSSEDRMLAHQHTISLWWLALSVLTIAVVFFLMRMLVARGFVVEAALANAALMLLISPVSWSHHWVWIPLWMLVFAWHWRVAVTVVARRLWASCFLALGALALLEPPKWWFGDGVNVWELEVWKKVVINDYTIAAYLVFIVVFIALRFSDRAHT